MRLMAAIVFASCLLLFSLPSVAKTKGEEIVDACRKKEKSHASAVNCEADELEELEQKLETVYAEAHRESVATEEDNKDSVAYEGLAKQLEETQKAFKIYIETECDYEAQIMGAGTFAADARARCRIDLIEARAHQLKRAISSQ
ncbi:MAG: lysozyme inhibitor LprI family protein [Alphaproteobacteria bacterium]